MHIYGAYQVYGSLSAYIPPLKPSVPKAWTVNILPDSLTYVKPCYQYFWYVANRLLANTKPHINYYHLNITAFVCSSNTALFSVYPSLLNWYMTQWEVQPHAVFKCNDASNSTINILHYATLTLLVNDINSNLELNVTFESHSYHLPEVIVTSDSMYSASILHKAPLFPGNVQLGYINATQASVVFDSFNYEGPQYSFGGQDITDHPG